MERDKKGADFTQNHSSVRPRPILKYIRRMRADQSIGFQDHSWSESEHERFLAALEAHGGEGDVDHAWAAIATAVGSRNIEEVKLHAHEYFFKLQNGEPCSVRKNGLCPKNEPGGVSVQSGPSPLHHKEEDPRLGPGVGRIKGPVAVGAHRVLAPYSLYATLMQPSI